MVARRIEEIRGSKKLSREQLADILASIDADHWDRLKVFRHETGRLQITAEVAAVYAEALGVSIASLYRESRAAS